MTYNQPVQPRGQGEETNVKIPDFIVVKGSATLSGDVPLLIVEVKRDESDDVIARNQITNYMGAFITKFGNMKLKAALVQGSRVSIYSDLRHNIADYAYRCSSMNGPVPLLSWQSSRRLRLSLMIHF